MDEKNSIILFNIISKYILSIIILHSDMYKHHYLSLTINIIFLIGLAIFDIINIKRNTSYVFYAFIRIIMIILFGFEDVYAKINLALSLFVI